MKNKILHIIIFITILITGCTEPYPITSESFEELIVVDATLTDSLQFQIVKLTKSFPLNTDVPTYVNNASVYIQDNNNQIFNFSQVQADSTYISDIPFKAEQGKSYSLHIITEEGKVYESSQEKTPLPITIEDVYGQRVDNYNGTEGILVSTDINPVQEGNTYCRIDYMETNKIVTPYVSNLTTTIGGLVNPYYIQSCNSPSIFYYILLNNREENVNICYKTKKSEDILLTNTATNNTIIFPVKYIEGDDYLIKERYSILVTAYSENYNSYQYYATLKKLNNKGNNLSPNQPGFINGNIQAINNKNEKIIGYFNVASVKMKRIFFNHSDFSFPPPNYISECEIESYNYSQICDTQEGDSERKKLYDKITRLNYQLLWIEWPDMNTRIYVIAPPECSDCTTFASNVKPDFWED